MSLLTALRNAPRSSSSTQLSSLHELGQTRLISSSPYGRTHVWKRRPKTFPNPCVPVFPQLVVRADGATYTHYITSPRSVFRLTRDTTNHPLWNTTSMIGEGDEGELTGRLGRFNRRFEGIGGAGGEVKWMEGVDNGVPLTQEQLDEMRKSVWSNVKSNPGESSSKKGGPGSGRRK